MCKRKKMKTKSRLQVKTRKFELSIYKNAPLTVSYPGGPSRIQFIHPLCVPFLLPPDFNRTLIIIAKDKSKINKIVIEPSLYAICYVNLFDLVLITYLLTRPIYIFK